jgi:hypothetical protein
MPQNNNKFNVNPQVNSILSWHSHDTGGVAVPFKHRDGFDVSASIDTPLSTRLERLAKQIVKQPGETAAIFLVGGPGNGKSHATEQFLRTIDQETGCQGKLIEFLQTVFSSADTPPSKVIVRSSDLPDCDGFAKSIGTLVLVQDASAADKPDSNVSDDLSTLIEEALLEDALLFCCANRGILSDAANQSTSETNATEMQKIIKAIQDNTSMAGLAGGSSLKCWPLPINATEGIKEVYAWPMDLESICETPDGAYLGSPADSLLSRMSSPELWDNGGPCTDCSAAPYCPFLQNARAFRKERTRSSVVEYLRHAELLSGQRWNFRTLYSLFAELAVGHRQDFKGSESACEWVESQVTSFSEVGEETARLSEDASWLLFRRRFEHSLFDPLIDLTQFIDNLGADYAESMSMSSFVTTHEYRDSDSQLRRYLTRVVQPKLDPAILGYRDGLAYLGELEDAYSQSVSDGNQKWKASADALEKEVFQYLADDESKLEADGSAESGLAERLALRKLASNLAKRSRAFGSNTPIPITLKNYHSSLRDHRSLRRLNTPLLALIGDSNRQAGKHFNLMSVFGQPSGSVGGGIGLHLQQRGMLPPEPAPPSDSTGPRHDYPILKLEPDGQHSEFITFELFEALTEIDRNQSIATLSTGIRATAARLASYAAAQTLRNADEFIRGSSITVGSGRWKLTLNHIDGQLEIED